MTPAISNIFSPAWQAAVFRAAQIHNVPPEWLVGEAWICSSTGKTTDFFQSRVRRELRAQFSAARLAEAAAVWDEICQPPAIPGEETDPDPRAERPARLSTREVAEREGITQRAAQIRRKKWFEKQRLAIDTGQGQLLLFGGAL